jgi:alanyl-tRNA synthetase
VIQVDYIVNDQIKKVLPVYVEELSVEEAKKSGALGFFEHKYGEKVKVYTVGKSTTEYYSKEICGGPHVTNIKELHHFKILKEEASSAGIRRIKAIVFD